MKRISAVLAAVLSFASFHSPRADERDPYRPLDHLWAGTRDIPDTTNAIIFGLGTLGTLAALSADNSVHDFFANQNRLGGWEVIGTVWGYGIFQGVFAVSAILYGHATDHPHELDTGEAMLEGLVANAAYTGVIKLAVHRERPDAGNSTSFPSGHTSTAFATAGCLFEMVGPAAGVPALGLGVYTAVSRLASNVHWLSDTVFGATLGYVVGRSYSKHHLSPEEGGTRVSLLPYFDSADSFGVTAQLQF